MALTRPNLASHAAFDATSSTTFTFTVSGGTQVTANRLIIKNNATNVTVYDQTQTTTNFVHTVAANTLTNGVYYNAQVQTLDGDGNYSALSNTIQFYAYSTPTVSFTNIPASGIIEYSSFEFTAQYTQAEGEALSAYIMVLYSSTGVQLSTSGTQYVSSTTVPLTISYLFSGFENNTTYKIKLTATTVNNTTVDTGMVQFTVQYGETPITGEFTVTNNVQNGYITAASSMTDLSFSTTNLTGIRIKRRKSGEFDWVTLVTIPMTQATLSAFSYNDYYNQYGITYQYAMVPLISGLENGYITRTVTSCFDGVFICDSDNIFKLYTDVGYDGATQEQKVGVFEPIGRKYPITVANATTNYMTGGVSCKLLDSTYLTSRTIDRQAIVQYTTSFKTFLTNKKAKILKDWNGNIWLIMIIGSPSISYNNSYGMGLADVNFQWVEQGDPDSYSNLVSTGLIQLEG